VAVLRGSASSERLAGAGITHGIEGKDSAELLALLRRGVVDTIQAPDTVLRDPLARQKVPASRVHAAPLEQASHLFAAACAAMPEAGAGACRLPMASRRTAASCKSFGGATATPVSTADGMSENGRSRHRLAPRLAPCCPPRYRPMRPTPRCRPATRASTGGSL
jgi:hypothetical protein